MLACLRTYTKCAQTLCVNAVAIIAANQHFCKLQLWYQHTRKHSTLPLSSAQFWRALLRRYTVLHQVSHSGSSCQGGYFVCFPVFLSWCESPCGVTRATDGRRCTLTVGITLLKCPAALLQVASSRFKWKPFEETVFCAVESLYQRAHSIYIIA